MSDTSLTISEAAVLALRIMGRPSTIAAIYDTISENSLFSFGAKDPKSVLQIEVLRRCQDVDISKPYGEKYFIRTPEGLFALLEWKEVTSEYIDTVGDNNTTALPCEQELKATDISDIHPSVKYIITFENYWTVYKYILLYKDPEVSILLCRTGRSGTKALKLKTQDLENGAVSIDNRMSYEVKCSVAIESLVKFNLNVNNLKVNALDFREIPQIAPIEKYYVSFNGDRFNNRYFILYRDIQDIVLAREKDFKIAIVPTGKFNSSFVVSNEKILRFKVYKEHNSIGLNRNVEFKGESLENNSNTTLLNEKKEEATFFDTFSKNNEENKTNSLININPVNIPNASVTSITKPVVDKEQVSIETGVVQKTINIHDIGIIKPDKNYIIKVSNNTYRVVYKNDRMTVLIKNESIILSLSSEEFYNFQFTDSMSGIQIYELVDEQEVNKQIITNENPMLETAIRINDMNEEFTGLANELFNNLDELINDN